MNSEIIKTILLVEDEVITAMLETQQLEKYGYSVYHVTTGEEAVKTIIDNTLPINLILMDINLGSGIDGTQAAEEILKVKDVPVVFLSSHNEPEVVEKTEKITSYGYVVKNSSITVLDASIKMAFKLFDFKMAYIQKEEELTRSEYQYRKLFENMNVSFAVHEAIYDDNGNPVDYRFLDMNPMFLNGVGRPASAMRGHTAKELFPNTEQYWIDIFGEVAKTGESAFFQNYSSELDKWFSTFVFSPQKNLFAVFFIDITERVRAEERLKVSENLLAETESIGKVGGWSFNIDTLEQKWTDEVYRIHEVEIEPNPSVEAGINYYTKESRPIVEKAVQRAIEHGENFDLELEIITAKGNRRAVHTIGKADLKNRRIYGFFQDITDHKRVEETLQQSEVKLGSIIRNSPVGLYIYMLESESRLVFKMFNPAADIIIRVSHEQFIGQDILEAFPALAGTGIPEMYIAVAKGELNTQNFEIPYDYQGIKGVYDVRAFQGEPGQVIVSFTDISERKQAEKEIKKQLDEKEILLREVHHRVKNNIANIEALLSLQADSSANIEVKTALQDAISRVQCMRILYDKLLITKEYQVVSIKNYTENLIDSIFEVYNSKKNIIIEKHISEFSLLSKQAVTIGIIINELLTNVFKYAFKNREKGNVSVSIDKKENSVIIYIQDNGIGIDKRNLENKSPGFGLAIVKMLVEQSQGTYCIEDENGTKSIIQLKIE